MKNKLHIDSLSLRVLNFLGNAKPSKRQLLFVEDLINTSFCDSTPPAHENLTPREQSCLYLTALGLSTKEIGAILKIKDSTVVTYRKEIIRKLKCKNMVQAVFNGLRIGIITSVEDNAPPADSLAVESLRVTPQPFSS